MGGGDPVAVGRPRRLLTAPPGARQEADVEVVVESDQRQEFGDAAVRRQRQLERDTAVVCSMPARQQGTKTRRVDEGDLGDIDAHRGDARRARRPNQRVDDVFLDQQVQVAGKSDSYVVSGLIHGGIHQAPKPSRYSTDQGLGPACRTTRAVQAQ